MSTFEGHKYINLETFRKSGEGIRTPLWFAENEDGVLYARSFERTGKAKRLRREPAARVAPCDVRGNPSGEWVPAEAWILDPGSEEAKRAHRMLGEKYGFLKRVLEFFAGLRHGGAVAIRIRPEITTSSGTSGEE